MCATSGPWTGERSVAGVVVPSGEELVEKYTNYSEAAGWVGIIQGQVDVPNSLQTSAGPNNECVSASPLVISRPSLYLTI